MRSKRASTFTRRRNHFTDYEFPAPLGDAANPGPRELDKVQDKITFQYCPQPKLLSENNLALSLSRPEADRFMVISYGF
jgi:hypothetical protein